jgi:hypothetical protein
LIFIIPYRNKNSRKKKCAKVFFETLFERNNPKSKVWIAVAIVATVHCIRLNWEAGKLKAMKSLAYNFLAVHIPAMNTILAGITLSNEIIKNCNFIVSYTPRNNKREGAKHRCK